MAFDHVTDRVNVAAAEASKPVPTTGAVAGIRLTRLVAETKAVTNFPVCIKLANVPSPTALKVSSQSSSHVIFVWEAWEVKAGVVAITTAPKSNVKVGLPCVAAGVEIRPDAVTRNICPGALK